MSTYKNLKIWEGGKKLAKLSYLATSKFPKEELYGLTSQIRRSSVSIPSNIAEGHARHSIKDFARFLSIAGGSLAELETQFLLSEELGFINGEDLSVVLVEIENLNNMLWSFRKNLRDKIENAA